MICEPKEKEKIEVVQATKWLIFLRKRWKKILAIGWAEYIMEGNSEIKEKIEFKDIFFASSNDSKAEVQNPLIEVNLRTEKDIRLTQFIRIRPSSRN